MKKHLLLFFVVITTTIFQQCTLVNNQPGTAPDQAIAITPSEEGESEEEQDGIREAQEMEFEMTKDVALGYVPKDRLVAAYDNLMQQRKQSPSGVAGIAALTWTERGPNTNSIGPSNGNTRGTQAATDAVTSGRMRAIWVDLDNTNYPNNVWIGSVSGGLWRTTNITSTSPAVWSLVNDFLGNLAISSICQDPTNTDILYFGTGEKTFNGDAVRGGGIWRSTDHGVTWALMPGTSTYYNVSKVVCDAAGNLYVGTIAGAGGTAGVLRYNKVAATWDNISPTGLSARITEMRISTTGRLHVVCGYFNTAAASSGLRYTDNPATVTSGTWTAPTTPIPNTLTPYNVELAVAGSTLYAQCSNSSFLIGGIYKSTDGGVTWAAVTTPPAGTAEPSILPGAQAWYDLAIGCDPNNPNIVIAGGLNFYRSTDGGTTWSQLSRWVGTALQYVHADHHSVVWNTNNTGTGTQVLLATDGGIFYSSDNGASFTDRNDGIRSKQFYSCAIHPTTTNYFIGGTQDNGTHQLTSAGLGASTEVIGGDGGFTHIDEDEPQFQFSAFTGTNFIRSTNGGSNWASVANFGNGQFINPSDYDNGANRMYFSFAGGNYARWDNPQTGTNAFAVNVGAFNARPVLSVQVSPHTANRVFFGTDQGRVVRVDNAHTATPTATDISGSGMNLTTVSCIAVGTNDNNLIATFSNYGSVHVWASTTGGGAGGWTNISGNLPDIPVRWAMFYPENNTKAIVATELGIYETDLINGASTVWVQNTSFPVVKTNMLQYRKSDGLLLAATHGRGLWTAPIPFTNSYVRFATSYITRTEATTATTATCRPYRDYVVNMTIDQAPVGNANVTVSVSGGATATQGIDFDFTTNGNFTTPSNTLVFASGSTTPQPITIRIYNDADVESTESFTLNYTVSGATDALAAPSNVGYTFLIDNNDVAPSIYSGSYAIGTVNTTLNVQTPFRSNLQKYRIQYLYTAAELIAAGMSASGNITSMTMNVTTKNSTQPYTGFTISLGNTSAGNLSTGFISPAFTQTYSANYTSVAGNNVFNFTTPFLWDGTSNVVVNICFDNAPGTPDALADVVQGTAAPFGTGVRASTYSSSITGSGCSLPAAFISDVRMTVVFDAQGGNAIESALNANSTEYVGNNGSYNFYNGLNILSTINGASNNLGCVTSSVFEAGNTWQPFGGGQRSQKVIDITPTTNSGASYTVSVYYSAAELTGQTPTALKIAKTTAATMAAADGTNTIINNSTTATPYGTGYIYTATFTGFSKFFLVNASVALPVTLVSFSGNLNTQNYAALQWKVSNEVNLRGYEVERSYDGVQFATAGIVSATGSGTLTKDYGFTDPAVAKLQNYYRLKMVDNDGRFRYSNVILLKSINGSDLVQLLKNPVQDNITLAVNNRKKERIVTELFNSTGQLVSKWDIGSADGTVQLPFTNEIAAGVYNLRLTIGNKQVTLRVVKQ